MRAGRIDALNAAVLATCDAAALNPVVADRVRLGIITFSGDAEVTLPLCDLCLLDGVPTLEDARSDELRARPSRCCERRSRPTSPISWPTATGCFARRCSS